MIRRVARSFTVKPNGSNSILHELSVVKRQTEIKFLMMVGDMRTSLRENEEREVEPTAVTGDGNHHRQLCHESNAMMENKT